MRPGLLAAVFASIAIVSSVRADGAVDTIVGIDVEGNTRTASDVVVGALEVRPGDQVDDESLTVLRQRVLNLRLFQEVEVAKQPSDGGTKLSVRVKERWTLIPIPIIGASDGAAQAGLALLETNLFGRRKLLVVSGVYSSTGQSGFLYYQDPALLGTRAILAVELVAENVVRERAEGFDVTYAFRDRRLEGSVRPGFMIGSRLSLRAGPFAALREAGQEEGHPAPPPAGNDFGLAADVEYEGHDYQDWYNAGPYVYARIRQSFPALGSDRRFTRSEAYLLWSEPVGRGHVASAGVSGFLAEGDPVLDAYRLGGRPGFRGLREDGLWAERATAATIDYQVPIWRPRWGTMSTIGFVDAGVATWSGERTTWVAPGAGIRLYVRNVALPALGLDLAWSTEGDTVAPSFFLGFR
jgi:outer membrane protein assembly factor BamA